MRSVLASIVAGLLISSTSVIGLQTVNSWDDTGLWWVDVTEGSMNCTLTPYLAGTTRVGGFIEIQVMNNDIDLYLRHGGITYASATRPAGYAVESVHVNSTIPGWQLCAYGYNLVGTTAGGFEMLSNRW